MAQLPAFDPIAFLTNRKFASASGLGLSADRYARKNPVLTKQIAAYTAELRALSQDQFKELLDREIEKQKAELVAKAKAEEEARFFNQAWTNADFDYWSKAAHWTLDEAIALSFGKAPEKVHWKNVEPSRQVSAFAIGYGRRRELALRAVTWKQLYDPVLPGIFLAWAKRTDLSIPPELEAAVSARGIQIADWKKLYDELKAAHKELQDKFEGHHQEWIELTDKKSEGIKQLLAEVEQLRAQLKSQAEFSARFSRRADYAREGQPVANGDRHGREGLRSRSSGIAQQASYRDRRRPFRRRRASRRGHRPQVAQGSRRAATRQNRITRFNPNSVFG